ncbi:unnamed protein product [Rangifer tarandus platyrhynchus]|uniref:Uncharacterized protein n=1 Tax=Rangifer tarandus platyrhynchus TaxID=3082113 RepID=A0AC60A520_RANTA
MAARGPQEPAGALSTFLGARGTGSPRARPKLGGVFRCVEDAFENKTLPLDALGGGHRGRRGGEPYSGPSGYRGSPSEPGGDGLGAAARPPERPSAAQAHGPQQVVAAVWGLRAAGPDGVQLPEILSLDLRLDSVPVALGALGHQGAGGGPPAGQGRSGAWQVITGPLSLSISGGTGGISAHTLARTGGNRLSTPTPHPAPPARVRLPSPSGRVSGLSAGLAGVGGSLSEPGRGGA